MIDEALVNALKAKYPDMHPLLFHRSLERAKSGGELFDILDSMPAEFPVLWSDDARRWVTTKDLFQAKNFSGDK